jgi:hypothetical protein
MEEHNAILKNEWLQASLIGTDIDPLAPFPFVISSEILTNPISTKKMSSSLLTNTKGLLKHFPSNLGIENLPINDNIKATLHDVKQGKHWEDPVVDSRLWKRQVAFQKGTPVYCKWKGGIIPQLGYLFPLYYPATLLSDWTSMDGTYNTTIKIEFNYRKVRWNAVVNFRAHVVPVSYVWMVMQDYLQAHRKLAQKGRYLDASIPPGTKVWALYHDDNVVYTGRVLHNHEIPWHKVHVDKYYNGIPGPYLWLEWENEGGNWDIIPKHHCRIINQEKPSSSPTVLDLRQQRSNYVAGASPSQAILSQMKSMGKSLRLESPKAVTFLWNGYWYRGYTCQEMPSSKTLLEHLQFEDCTGAYYYVYWVEKGTHILIPKRLIR